MKRDVTIEVTYPHPPEKVWRAITDKELVAKWLMPNDLEPVVGREFQFRTTPMRGWNGIVDCRVLEADPPRRLSYTWRSEHLDTVVTWTLTPVASGTKLTLEHTGFTGVKNILLSFLLGSGWKKHLNKTVRELLAQL